MLAFVAILLSVLLGFGTLALDVSVMRLDDARLQTAVDAAALAGVSALPDTASARELALYYAEANGAHEGEIEVSFEEGDTVITVSATTSRAALFAGILGEDELDGYATASAKKKAGGYMGPFAYRLFTGSPTSKLQLGGKFNIEGSIHSNGNINASPSTGNITGAAEATGTCYINQWTATAGSQLSGAPFIEMVDFTDAVDYVIPDSYNNFYTANDISSEWRKQYFTGNSYCEGNFQVSNGCEIDGNLYVNGNIMLSGSAPVIKLNGNIYATGSITFGNTAEINGCVFAGGNIMFNGGGLYLEQTDSVCIYSEHGNIDVNTATSEVEGIIYAPEGNVKVVGGTTTFYGSIVGNTITGIPADLRMLDPRVEYEFLKGEEFCGLIR